MSFCKFRVLFVRRGDGSNIRQQCEGRTARDDTSKGSGACAAAAIWNGSLADEGLAEEQLSQQGGWEAAAAAEEAAAAGAQGVTASGAQGVSTQTAPVWCEKPEGGPGHHERTEGGPVHHEVAASA